MNQNSYLLMWSRDFRKREREREREREPARGGNQREKSGNGGTCEEKGRVTEYSSGV